LKYFFEKTKLEEKKLSKETINFKGKNKSQKNSLEGTNSLKFKKR
jgi:hypothetical protein